MENLKKFHVVVAYFISFIILSSSYVPALGMYDMFSGDMGKIYKSTGISEYYNLMALLPVKLVTKFVSNEVGAEITVNPSDKNKRDNANGKDKKTSKSNDIAFVKVLTAENSGSYGGSGHIKYPGVSLKHEYAVNIEYLKTHIVFFVLIMLLGLKFLARGDTEDYVKNINMQKFRLG